MDITIVNRMFLKQYLDDDVHIKENVRIDALKNEGKIKCYVRQKRKRNQL